jgi:hypothetical protein
MELGRIFPPVAYLHVGEFGVILAVRLAGFRTVVAESEGLSTGLADRPAAGNDTAIRARRDGLRARRRDRNQARQYNPWLNGRRRRHRHRRDDHTARHHDRRAACARQRRQGRPLHAPRCRSAFGRGFAAFPANGRGSGSEVETMGLADDRVLGNAQAPANFGGRMTLRPKLPETADDVLVPLHLVGPPPGSTTRYGIDPAVGVNSESESEYKKLWTTFGWTTRPRGSGLSAAGRERLFPHSPFG